jgi:hypothetical protein
MQYTSLRQITVPLTALAAILLLGSVVSAWSGPTDTPPDGNAWAPLNVGSTAQSKSGGLLLNTGGATNGLIVASGNVGIGTTDPAGTLDVNGSICIDGNCISDWPTGGELTFGTTTNQGGGDCPDGSVMTGATVSASYHSYDGNNIVGSTNLTLHCTPVE